jgi:hypothetical protein
VAHALACRGELQFALRGVSPATSATCAAVTDELRPTPAFNAREREREWLHLNGPRYAGQWVAIEGDKLVSHGENAKAVLHQARAEGVQHPLLMQIPKEPPLPFGGW